MEVVSSMAPSCHVKARVLLIFTLTIMMTLLSTILTTISLSSPSSDILPNKVMQSRAADGMRHTYTINTAGDESLLKTNVDRPIHSEQERDYFFDCHSAKSKCTYFYPGEFYRHYFDNILLLSSSSTTTNATSSNNDSYNTSNNEIITRIKDRIGLNNANLPALDSFSWWMNDKRGGAEHDAV